MASTEEIIAAINPDLYYEGNKQQLKSLVKEKGVNEAIKELKNAKKFGKPQAIKYSYSNGKFTFDPEGAEVSHTLTYDSSSETLEPVYFFLIDLMNDKGLSPQKLVDNFSSTPGSGHFAELGQRATIMQQQATKLLGDVNTVLRSVLNIVYDLKEFKIRLQHYDGLKSKKKEEQDAAVLALKQIWMDKVDVSKGNSSIKAMAFSQGGAGRTLIDAFLIAKDAKDVEKLDLNDVVKRILIPRIHEFNIWLEQSEKELRKRYELEKTYLKSQVNSLKLYSKWIRPYLKAASDLTSKEAGREPSLVKTFNTIILELVVFGKGKLNIPGEVAKGNLPDDFAKPRFLKSLKREYYSCFLIDFTFRGIPQRVSQQAHYAFGGKAEVTFKGYALNDDEINKLFEELDKSEVTDILSLIEGTTSESLGPLQDEINSFLEEDEEKEKPKSMGLKDLFEPFTALFSKDGKTEKQKKEKPKTISPDNWIEKTHFRKLAAEKAQVDIYDIFDIYKKAHGMESYT